MRRAAALLAAALGLGAARPPVPLLVPRADATVTYLVTPPDRGGLEVRADIAAGGGRLRLTAAALPAPILLDRASGSGAVLVPFLSAYAPFSLRRFDPRLETRPDARFQRIGAGRQAGLLCTNWRVAAGGEHFSGCVTADGLILRGEGRGWRLEAVRVTRGALPAEIFQVPAGFRVAPVDAGTLLGG